MRVSFDYDATLSRKDVQEFAKKLVSRGIEVWIVTSRFDDETAKEKAWWWIKDQNNNLFEVADECGIQRENIKFTNMESKSIFLKDKGFTFHLDDDYIELLDILESGDKCLPVNVDHFEWKDTCLNILNM
jgi:hypothetical protein